VELGCCTKNNLQSKADIREQTQPRCEEKGWSASNNICCARREFAQPSESKQGLFEREEGGA